MKKKIRAKYPRYHFNEMKGRDNKDYYNTRGRNCSMGIFERVPSLKRNKKTWENFYKLFPYVKKFLESMGKEGLCVGKSPIRITLKDNIYTVVDERVHGIHWVKTWYGHITGDSTDYRYDGVSNSPRRRTTKFLKVW